MFKKLSNVQIKILEILRSSIGHNESLSLRELANLLDLDSPNAVLYHIRRLEELGYLVRDQYGKVVRVNSPDEITGGIALLPLLGRASCGQALDHIVDEATVEMVPIPLGIINRNLKSALYLIKAVGKSMEPKIEDGDLVVFEPGHFTDSGRIVVARTQEGFVIKKFKEIAGQYLLESINPQFGNLVFNKTDEGKTFNIDGVAIGVFKSQRNLTGGDK
ncbi:MAG: winged helix-turn-helix transcriptional regulator [Candidatus Levybacteria bacterium]|nr:winged helix-turn-helix transcriptional regulator [Candidatus Levybacteria bacterium]